ncbi:MULTISPECIES: hypothetical protein [Pontibacillus]|uniref:DUF2788 domain-containing protein n=1 Tax=Pontibacillus chungwhensis TaxID=265426 RepID=A0ABY8V405_9BACI|nr:MULTISPECIES: hypothetical protein [Pontibacillus]MCD5324361.1 hypothetical protein [Pontibacillus sp. HN14]WIF99340.1 hypothetical protein QNI29_06700 [Pontibacillus chungwhensis]
MSLETFLPYTTSGALIIGVVFSLIYSLYIKKSESKGWTFTVFTFLIGVISSSAGVMILKAVGTIE